MKAIPMSNPNPRTTIIIGKKLELLLDYFFFIGKVGRRIGEEDVPVFSNAIVKSPSIYKLIFRDFITTV